MRWSVLWVGGITGAIALVTARAAAQEATLMGHVTSESGAPVASVSVFVERMNLGATTDDKGDYRFIVPGARVQGQRVILTAREIGFRAQSVSITLRPGVITHDFSLISAPVLLQQLVVTGEGTITQREKLGNVVNTIDNRLIQKSNETNVTEALAGKAPNVQIQQQSGDPGSSVSIQIRGIKTLTGDAQPLFVVDGVPIDNQAINIEQQTAGYAGQGVVAPNRAADLNPNDVESVTILKGAAAGAIYGARAAQGVVLITTKSGLSGATRYSLHSSVSFDNVTQGYQLQRQFGQGDGGVVQPCGAPDQSCSKFTWGPALAPGTPTYDHFHEMFETGHIFDNMLSVSGGDDRRTFYISGGATNHQGFLVGPNDDYKRYTARLKATQMIGDRLQIGGNIAYVDSRGSFVQRGNNVSGIMLGGLRTPPEFNNRQFLSADGLQRSYRFPDPTSASLDIGRGYDNPFWVMNDMPATSNLSRVYGNVDANWNPFDWLKVQEVAGADYYTDQRLETFPKTNSTIPAGQINRADFNNYILDHNLTATASHTFSPRFSGTLTLGQNLNSTDFRQVYVSGFTLVTPTPLVLSNTVSYNPNDEEILVHREAYFGQATADLWDQLFLTAALRNDGFSTFGQNSRRHWFPKASASWTFSKLLGDLNGRLDFGKMRFAYGQTGKEPQPYATLNTFLINQFFEYGNVGFVKTLYQGAPGLTSPPSLGNNNLKPERTREYEGGIDLGGFKGLTDLSVTYYSSKSTDVVFNLPIPPSSGYKQQIGNAASIENKGWEVTWNWHPLRTPTVSWDLGLIWSRNRNKVLSIAGANEVPVGTYLANPSAAIIPTVARVGFPVGTIEGKDFVRCGRGATLADGTNVDQTFCTGAPNGALYIDANGFPVIDDSLRILGSAQPNWAGSVRNSITLFKKLELSALVDIRRGNKAYDGTRGALYVYGTHADTRMRGQTFVFGPSSGGVPGFHGDAAVVGPGAHMPVVIGQDWFQGDGGSFSDNAADFVENAGFVKLREISVAYTFDQPWVQRTLGLSSLDVRLSGRNLHTWTKFRGIDPETNLEGAGLVQGVDWFNNPQTRSIVLSVGLER